MPHPVSIREMNEMNEMDEMDEMDELESFVLFLRSTSRHLGSKIELNELECCVMILSPDRYLFPVSVRVMDADRVEGFAFEGPSIVIVLFDCFVIGGGLFEATVFDCVLLGVWIPGFGFLWTVNVELITILMLNKTPESILGFRIDRLLMLFT